jgi:hypothetical protein
LTVLCPLTTAGTDREAAQPYAPCRFSIFEIVESDKSRTGVRLRKITVRTGFDDLRNFENFIAGVENRYLARLITLKQAVRFCPLLPFLWRWWRRRRMGIKTPSDRFARTRRRPLVHMSLIKRTTIPKRLTTAQLMARWGWRSKKVRRICQSNGVRFVQTAPTAPKEWLLPDVERVEQKLFGEIL